MTDERSPSAKVVMIKQGNNRGKQVVLLRDLPPGTELFTLQEAGSVFVNEMKARLAYGPQDEYAIGPYETLQELIDIAYPTPK